MVSIKLVFQNGIIKRTENAVNSYNEAQTNELQKLNELENQIANIGKEPWYNFTEEEKNQLIANEHIIAQVNDEKMIVVIDWRIVDGANFPVIQVLIENGENSGTFIFAIEDFNCDVYNNEIGTWQYSFKKNKWYKNTINASVLTVETTSEYKGKFSMTVSDFEGGQIYCESILQKIIDAF